MGSFLISKAHVHDTHLHARICEQKADLEGLSREEMYAPPEHAAPATPLRDDVVTEGALVGSWDGFGSGSARVCVSLSGPLIPIYTPPHHLLARSTPAGGAEQQRRLLALSEETARQQYVVPTVVDKGQA